MAQFPTWSIVALYSAIRLALTLVLFFGIVPYLIFPRRSGPTRSSLMQRAIWMTFLTVAAVHFLTLGDLYSVFALLAVYGAVAVWTMLHEYDASTRSALWFGVLALIGEAADNRVTLPHIVAGWFASLYARVRSLLAEGGWRWLAALLVLAAIGLAFWVRFVPIFQTAALPFSDSPLDLAWSKYPVLEILYHNKIYPRGLYVFMSALEVLSGTNPIIVLRFFYPGLSVLVVAAVVYLVYRNTESLTSAAVAGFLLGVSRLIPYVNAGYFQGPFSQQFGTAFAMLFVVFAIQYVQNGRRHDLTTAAIAGGMTAFIHPVPVVLVAMSTLALFPVGLLTVGAKAWRRMWHLVAGTVLIAGVAVLPVTIALLQGQAWHTASLSFLSNTTSNSQVLINLTDVGIALAVVAVLSLIGVWAHRRRGAEARWARQVMLMGVAAAFVLPHLVPQSSFVIAARSVQALVIATVIVISVGWSVLEALLGSRWYLTIPITTVALAGLLRVSPPQVYKGPNIYPYYVGQMVYQTLHADLSFVPHSWTLVTGPTGYALALGESYHQYPQSFLAMVRKLPQSPMKWIKSSQRLDVGVSQHYVLMAEKVVPLAAKLPKSQVSSRLSDGAALIAWVAKNATRLHIHQVVNNAQIEVWYFSVPLPPNPS